MLDYRNAWLAGGWLLVGSIVYLSLMPHPPEFFPPTFSNIDKLEHCLAYGAVALWFCQLYFSPRSRMVAMAVLVGLGIGLEYVQGWTGYRTFDVWDMAANSAGVLLGLLLMRTPLGRLFIAIEAALRR